MCPSSVDAFNDLWFVSTQSKTDALSGAVPEFSNYLVLNMKYYASVKSRKFHLTSVNKISSSLTMTQCLRINQ